jgi:hypothetical protein
MKTVSAFIPDRLLYLFVFAFLSSSALMAAATDSVLLPGPKPDGSMLLPNQWSLRPAGKQLELGDFPVNIAVHPDSRFAAVLHCGYSRHEVVIVELANGEVSSHANLVEAFTEWNFHPTESLFSAVARAGN